MTIHKLLEYETEVPALYKQGKILEGDILKTDRDSSNLVLMVVGPNSTAHSAIEGVFTLCQRQREQIQIGVIYENGAGFPCEILGSDHPRYNHYKSLLQ